MNWAEPGAFDLLVGSLLYLVGSILVTMICNVPLNDRLAAVKPESAEGKTLWTHYLSRVDGLEPCAHRSVACRDAFMLHLWRISTGSGARPEAPRSRRSASASSPRGRA